MAILEVVNLHKSFGHTEVLKGIDFTLEKSESVAIIGSSGSGKTTLLRCLNFLETPSSGKIIVKGETLYDGENPATRSEQKIRSNRLHFGLVFQSFNLFPQYTAKKNVTLACELLAKDKLSSFSMNSADISKNAESLLERMNLADKMDLYPHQLSGGQQQRVAIARALALSPDILCFDEPTSALDPELTGEVLKVIKSLADVKTTMIIVTHEMAFAREVADKVVFMDEGIIAEQGDAKQVIDNPANERTKQFLAGY